MRKYFLLVFCFVVLPVSACSVSKSSSLSETERAEAMIADGVEQDVAECVAGIETQTILQNSESDATAVAKEELLASCQDLYGIVAESQLSEKPSEEVSEISSKKSSLGYGDDEALDLLWDRCKQGSGQDCNQLFDEAPLGSEYEQFGVSCGAREGILRCEDVGTDSEPVPRIATEASTAKTIQ